jgi:hypothetical protein
MRAMMVLGCFFLGYQSPLTSSSGIAAIKENFGAASALYTFSFAAISGLLSLIEYFFHLVSLLNLVGLSWVVLSVLTLLLILILNRSSSY